MNLKQLAGYIDHTLLDPRASKEDIIKLCNEAEQHGFASVCIHPYHVRTARMNIKGQDTKICAVIGYPLGANNTAIKVFEARNAMSSGADELEVVINIGALKDEEETTVKADMSAIVGAGRGKKIKVVLETGYFDDEDILLGCELAKYANVDFVSTSSGFGPTGASLADVRLLAKTAAGSFQVKAAGDIDDLSTTIQMLQAGATRIGTSSGIKILEELRIRATTLR
ncbi:deoxyribose-phosphate aldolase [Desulfitispora alkaliphila]|uniref:deoxyribose-phosphate aldolase n=1 Tax=Desulfitispora alkaliphila TaxID=622674 RepID=UPI003D1A7EDB